MIRIVQANEGNKLRQFIKFPFKLYRGNPNFIAPLRLMQKKLLTPKGNPFFEHAESALFIAFNDDKRVVGRIAATHNRIHLNIYRDHTGFFGLSDCINDQAVANKLLDTAAGWLRSKGDLTMAGPENISANDSLGILTNGFETPPVFLMPYNDRYYEELLKAYGLAPKMKLYSYHLTRDRLPKEMMKKADFLEERLAKKGIAIRPVNLANAENDISRLRYAYNASNEGTWGFMPLDERGFRHMAEDLKKIALPGQVLVAENESGIIGYIVSVPDYYQVFQEIPDGRLFPFGWRKMLRAKKIISQIRIMILGVLPAYRSMGIDWCLYAKLAANNFRLGLYSGEACYVMEGNAPMKRMLDALGATVVKEYTMFSKEI
jgi:ribosomal protein S18 acetylase RimI-like enzyme